MRLGRRRFLLTVCTPVKDKDFFLPRATRRIGAGWGRLSALHVPNGPDLLSGGTDDLGAVLGSA